MSPVKQSKAKRNLKNYFPKCILAKSGFKICHINIRSLVPKIEQLRLLFCSQDIDILSVNETFLDDSVLSGEISISGYTLHRNDRGSRHGGGVALYVKSNINHTLVKSFDNSVESLWIKVSVLNKNPIFIGTMYRPPSADATYFDKMLDDIEFVTCDSHFVLLGDLNFDYVYNCSLSTNPVHYIEELFSCKQLITEPTRVTDSTATLLDVVLSDIPKAHSSSGVIKINLSDHYMIYTVFDFKLVRGPPKIVTTRSYKSFNLLDFKADLALCLSTYPLGTNNNTDTIEHLWSKWKHSFLNCLNRHAPLRMHRVSDRYKPWITTDIVKLMYERDHMHDLAVNLKCPSLMTSYRLLRNRITKDIESLEREYLTTKIDENKANDKQMWNILKKAMGYGDSLPPLPSNISAQQFNSFFSDIGKKLSEPFIDQQPYTWKLPSSIYTFEFRTITAAETLKYLMKFGEHSNIDILEMDSKLLRLAADVIAPSLTSLFNISICNGYFPQDWKSARVTPVYKNKGSTENANNYRPISVIPHVSKLIERLVQSQLKQYLTQHNFITPDQAAYRPLHSTETSLHKVIMDLLDGVNDGLVGGMCFFDLQKCFDTIDHEILLTKLNHYGIRGSPYKWFESYLSNRKQAVRAHGTLSDFQELTSGVPQGSVLGPILFLLFINDLPTAVKESFCNLFADDTILYAIDDSFECAQDCLQRDTDMLVNWFKENHLTVNIDKCCTMKVGSRGNINKPFNLSVSIGAKPMSNVNNANYLGVYLDETLSWDIHVTKLAAKISPKVAMLGRLRKKVSFNSLVQVYKTMVQPLFDYCITIWGFCSDKLFNKIQRFQNRAARFITGNFDYNVRGINLVKQLGFQTLSERRDYFINLLTYKCLHGQAPTSLSDNLTLVQEHHSRNTRQSSSNLLVPKLPHVEIFRQSFNYKAPTLWNQLTGDTRRLPSLDSFKKELKNLT